VIQMLTKSLLPAGAAAAKPGAAADESVACPHCGWTLRDVRQTNRFGCPRDYEVFGEVAEDLLERLQGQSQHCDLREESALDRLVGEMREAVQREDYEAAARLRDQVRALEASLEKEDALD
jgi:protein arginine kinase activator